MPERTYRTRNKAISLVISLVASNIPRCEKNNLSNNSTPMEVDKFFTEIDFGCDSEGLEEIEDQALTESRDQQQVS